MIVDELEAQFTSMYRECYPRVLAYALCRVDPDQAHEIVDEVFLIAWRRRQDVPSNALPWLLVTANNIVCDHRRRGRRQDALALELAKCADTMGVSGADAIVVERMTVLSALARLSDEDRDALMLTVWDGLTNREAAKVSGCSTATFTVRLHRARRRLAAALDESEAALRPSGQRRGGAMGMSMGMSPYIAATGRPSVDSP